MKFKVGDKVIYLGKPDKRFEVLYKDLIIENIYTVSHIYSESFIELYGFYQQVFNDKNFKELKKHRAEKINKINKCLK